jgi:hypothetical protein
MSQLPSSGMNVGKADEKCRYAELPNGSQSDIDDLNVDTFNAAC